MLTSKENKYRVPELVLVRKNIPSNPVRIKSTKDAHRVLISMWELESLYVEEHFCILLLDCRNQVIGFRCISQGNRYTVDTYLEKVLRYALIANADSLILAHNHPSEMPLPSAKDDNMTMRIYMELKRFDIRLHDHIILGGEKHYTSYLDMDRMPLASMKRVM